MKILDPDNLEKRQLLTWLSWAAVIISGISLVINLIIGMDLPVIHISYSAMVIYAMLAIILKRGFNQNISEYIIIAVSLIITNVLWFFEYGHKGPVLFLFVVIYSVSIFLWSGKKLIISTIILIINLAICFYIESTYGEFIPDYDNSQIRLVDMYASTGMFFVLFYALIRAVKKSYTKEYLKALQSDKLKSSFLENINHEVRTPLNAIIGFTSLMNEEDITKEQIREYNEMISESNDALLRIIDDIILVSTLESGNISTNISDCDLDNLIHSMYKTFKSQLVKAKKDNVELFISEPNISATVKTDKIRLQQVFLRIMDNAIKFTDSGKIKFGYRVDHDAILFHVADTGMGIEDKHQNKIFNRFYKVDFSNKRGTGIGLYITKKIMDSLGGKIWFSSIHGSGTTFYFSIPITE